MMKLSLLSPGLQPTAGIFKPLNSQPVGFLVTPADTFRASGPRFGETSSATDNPALHRKFYNQELTPKIWKQIAATKTLQTLNLSCCRGLEGLHHLRGLPALRELDLSTTSCGDEALKSLKDLPVLERLNLQGTKVTGKGLKHLQGLPLKALDLSFTELQDADLAPLAKMKTLEELNFCWSKALTNAALPHISGLNLTRLNLADTQTDNDGLKHLARMTQLKALTLRATKMTDAGLQQVVKQFPHLKELDLAIMSHLTDAGLQHLKPLNGLTTLYYGSGKITGQGIQVLENFPNLETLGMYDGQISGGLHFMKGLTKLKTLLLGYTKIQSEELHHLVGLQKLEHLDLKNTWIQRGFAPLAQLHALRELDLEGTCLQDKDLKHLKGLKNLRTLRLEPTQLTAKGLAYLKGLTNLEALSLYEAYNRDSYFILKPETVAELQAALPNLRIWPDVLKPRP